MANETEPGTNPAGIPGNDRRTAVSSMIFGGLMLAAAVLVIVDASALPDTGSAVGPAAAPLALGAALGAVGSALALRARAELRTAVRGTPLRRDTALRVCAMVGVLIAFAALLPIIGYVISSAGLFIAAALLLGAPRGWQLVAYGWSLAAVVFVLFDRLIGLTLPAGPWGF